MTDLFLLLLLPAGGDELQGIKRGIVELADVVLVNKADGELAAVAGRTVADYRNALRLMRPRTAGWEVQVGQCSAQDGHGIAEAFDSVLAFASAARASGQFAARRAEQAVAWMDAEIRWRLEERMRADPAAESRLYELTAAVRAGTMAPGFAAQRLVDIVVAPQPRTESSGSKCGDATSDDRKT